MGTKSTVTADCAHPATLAAFWRLALRYVEASPPEGFASRAEWLTHAGVPPQERDDAAYIKDPDGVGPASHSSRSPSPRSRRAGLPLTLPAQGPLRRWQSLGARPATSGLHSQWISRPMYCDNYACRQASAPRTTSPIILRPPEALTQDHERCRLEG